MNAAIAPSASTTTASAPVAFTRVPQVNLLPPDIAVAQGLRTVKRWAVLALAVVVLLLGVGYAYSSFEQADARADLAAAQLETTRLTAEQADYVEVPVVMGELADVKATRLLAASTEVLWRPYVDAIRAALPADAVLQTLQVSGATPVTPPVGPADVLQSQAVGLVSLTARTTTVPHAADWTDALGTIPGLVDARVQSVAQDSGEDSSGYLITMTMQYDSTALSGRFAATEES